MPASNSLWMSGTWKAHAFVFSPVTIFIFALSHLSSPSVHFNWCHSIAFQPLLGVIRTWLLLGYENAQSNLNKNYLSVFSSKLISFIQPSPESWLWGPRCSGGRWGDVGGVKGVIESTRAQAAQSCLTLCDPMDCSMSGFPVLYHLLKFAEIHVRWVGDAIQPSHPLSSPSPAPNPSQHQSLFQWVSSSHQVAKVLELQLQHQSFQLIFRVDFL